MIKRAFAVSAAFAVTSALGVGTALAATPSKTPVQRAAAHDGLSVPPALTHAITQKLGMAPRVASAQAPTTSTGSTGSTGSGQQQELQASDGMPLDLFGWTVSLTADGHTALVGAPGRIVGAAYVFVERGGKWTEQQELQSPGGSSQDSYGWSVSIAGDGQTAIVGAWSANGVQGTVYWYTLQGGSYVLGGQINASDGAPDDEFGEAVSLSGLGNVALISATGKNGFEGAVYVFARAGDTWKQVREYQSPVGPGEEYGYSVSESADGLTGVVGAPLANIDAQDNPEGAAYAFSEASSSQQALVPSATPPPTSLFGWSVSADALGDRLLVGSPSTNTGDGAAFVFQLGRGGWTQTQELVESDPSGADLFGYSVALDYLGNEAVIGAPERNGTDGGAYVFGGVGQLTQQRELTDPAAAGQGDEYGDSAAIDALGDELLIGAPYSNDAQGAAWVVSNNPFG